MAGQGLAALSGRLPYVSGYAPFIGILGAYWTGGAVGAISYGLVSGALGSLGGLVGGGNANGGLVVA